MGLNRVPDLYLMRHGQTEWNAAGRLQGRLDSPLTPLGQRQARRQAWLVRDLHGIGRFASVAGRARQTAQIVFAAQDYRTDPRLHEIDIGDLTGWSGAEVMRRHPDWFQASPLEWYDRAPNGEHFSGLHARCTAFLSELTGPAMIVTHGITLRMLRLIAMNMPIAQMHLMPVMQGAVHLVRDGRHQMYL